MRLIQRHTLYSLKWDRERESNVVVVHGKPFISAVYWINDFLAVALGSLSAGSGTLALEWWFCLVYLVFFYCIALETRIANRIDTVITIITTHKLTR